MKGKLIFEEKQRFIGTWTWYLVLGIGIFSVGGFVLAILFHSSDMEKLTGLTITIVVIGGVIWLFSSATLYVAIDERAIYYRYPPFVNSEKVLDRSTIKEMEVRTYQPIWEYGGYGYRFRFRSGRALNVRGNKGLQLVLSNNKRLLIGTQKPLEMEAAIARLKENWEMTQHV